MSHARLSPSAAARWMTCPAAPNREEGLPDKVSEYAEWGTAAHAILEMALLQYTHPADLDLSELVVESDDPNWAPSYKLVDRWGIHDVEEMQGTAAVAFEYVQFSGEILAESQVSPGSFIGRTDLYGTADIQILNPGHLEVVDLKGGAGVIVEPDTPQLKLYAAGCIYMHPIRYPSRDWANITVKLTIVQPRASHPAGPIRSIEMTAEELMNWMDTEVKAAAAATDNRAATGVPSEKGCKWCLAKPTCPELANAGLAAAQAVFQPVAIGAPREDLAAALTQDPGQLSPDRIAFILDNEALISGWLDAVRKYARDTLLKGGKIPGYKMVNGRSSRAWDQEPDELYKQFTNLTKQGGKKITKADLYTESFLSPAQAEKHLKELVSKTTWARIEEHIKKTAGKPTLAPASDRRPSIKPDAEEVFTPVTEQYVEPDFLS